MTAGLLQAVFADDFRSAPVAFRGRVPRKVSARVPADGDAVVFGIFLVGHGRIELRNSELRSS